MPKLKKMNRLLKILKLRKDRIYNTLVEKVIQITPKPNLLLMPLKDPNKKNVLSLKPKPRRNIANRIISNIISLNRSKIKKSVDFTFYGYTNGIPLALKLILKNGKQIIIQYHELQSPIRLKPGIITFSTPTLLVTIEGVNLEPVLDYISEHQLVWIAEPDNSWNEIEEKKEEPTVKSIKVEER